MNSFGSIGERLREERERLGLSQTEAADIAANAGVAGATRQSQALYEKGKRMPDAAYLAAIQAAGYNVLYILTGQRGGGASPPPLKPDEAALVDNYRHSPKDQQAILQATSAAFAKHTRRRSA